MIEADRASFEKRARICVIGVGGGGNNAVDRMIEDNIEGVEFIAVNTDAQVLARSKAPTRIQLGEKLTQGLGAGGDPDTGSRAAEESSDQLLAAINGVDMLFVTAGMGGGTGTGAAPVIAALAKKHNVLTVGVVTKPFGFEGRVRMENAIKGIDELFKNVDTLLVVPNDKLLEVMDDTATLAEGLKKADEVLTHAVQGISNIITNAGTINMDFADIRTTLKDKGMAHIGIGWADGKDRALKAAENAISSPLLETSIVGASAVLVNLVGPTNIGLQETNKASSYIQKQINRPDCNFIFGANMDMPDDRVMVTVVATGFSGGPITGSMKFIEMDAIVSPELNKDNDKDIDINRDDAPSEEPPAPAAKSSSGDQQIVLPVFVRRNKR